MRLPLLALLLTACGPSGDALDADGDGYSVSEGDCDDSRPDVYPDALAICGDEVDNDCDADVDEGESEAWYADLDADGFGDPEVSELGCAAPPSFVSDDRDCDDGDPALTPQTEWFIDVDGDGFGRDSIAEGDRLIQCAQPSGFVMNREDCNDAQASVFPGAAPDCGDDWVNDCLSSEHDEEAYCATVNVVGLTDAGVVVRGPLRDAFFGDALHVSDDGELLVGAPGWGGGGAFAFAAPGPGDYGAAELDEGIAEALDDEQGGGAVRFLGDVGGGRGDDLAVATLGDGSRYAEARVSVFFDGSGALSGFGDADVVIYFGRGSTGALSIAAPADLSGSSSMDLLFGAAEVDTAWVFKGKVEAGRYDENDMDYAVEGLEGSGFGASVVTLGDVNGDGEADFAVGAPDADSGAGVVSVFLGQVTNDLQTHDAEHELVGPTPRAAAGASLASAGDLDGDGRGDLLVGATGASSEEGLSGGAVYVVLAPFPAELDLRSADAVLSSERDGDLLGASLAGGQDVDGDGVPDVLIGAPRYNGGGVDSGAAFLFSGATRGAVSTADADLRFFGGLDFDYAGTSVALSPDLDGDGRAEPVVGAPGEDSAGVAAGAVYIMMTGDL